MNRRALLAAIAGCLLGGIPSRAMAEIIAAPQDLSGAKVYPNPWRSDRGLDPTITFADLPASVLTTLRIFTIAGEHVRTLSGTGNIPWDLRNASGESVASGVYLYLLSTPHQKKTGKIAIIR